MTDTTDQLTDRDGNAVEVRYLPGEDAYGIFVEGEVDPAGKAHYLDRPGEDGAERVFHHTVVDEAYGGRGLAGILVDKALADAAAQNLTVIPVDSPLYAAITETVGEFFPDAAVVPVLSAGGTDLRFARRLGGVGYGFALNARERSLADINAELHSHDEHLYLEDLRLTVEAYRSLVARFVG